jgi:aminoglycoside phosphotransferase (APT) family kinase protein
MLPPTYPKGMSRSPLTLAAAATAAVPDAVIVRTRALGGTGEGRFDAAAVELADGSALVVRAGVDAEADRTLRDELRALEALTPGIRSLLPFSAPRVHGRAVLADATAGVVDYLDGYRVATAELPPGGVAAAIGRAIAAVHDLPVSVVRAEGLPVRSPDRERVELSRVVDRAGAGGHIAATLRDRWRSAIDDDALWRFEPTVVLGGTDAERFVFTDDDEGPVLVGHLGWEGLSVGDPAVDLTWLAMAPDAAASVLDAYLGATHRAGDPLLAERARLYAELDFARWLLHGLDVGDDAIVGDAAEMLRTLAESTRGTDLLPRTGGDVAAAVDLLDRVPARTESDVDTSMQTDAYDPAALAAYLPDDQADPASAAHGRNHDDDGARDSGAVPTLPVDLSEWMASPTTTPSASGAASWSDDEHDGTDAGYAEEADRASESALRRWSDTGDVTRG